MANDSFTEVTNESWFSRIGGAIKGILVGIILFVVAFPLLFWNEGRAVKTYKTLKEGSGAVISVSSETVDPANAGKLIHVTGLANTDDVLSDPVFGISDKAISLLRNVEMYQWKEDQDKETKKKVGGGTTTTTTYNYSKVWSKSPINSSNFKKPDGHTNPGTMPYESEEWFANDVTVGDFQLPQSLVRKVGNAKAVTLSGTAELPAEIQGRATVQNNTFFVGSNPSAPSVGDVRVAFSVVKPTDVSVVAQQVNKTFEPYTAKAGGTIEMLRTGVLSADAMFEKAQQENRALTWILRAVGFLLMFIGLTLVLRPLSVVADVLPFLGNLVGAGTTLVSFLIAGSLSLITIAIAWIVFRPLLGIALLLVAAVLVVVVLKKAKAAKA